MSEHSAQPVDTYPVSFTVDYPDRPLNRLTTFFRIVVVIPIALVLSAVGGSEIDTWNRVDGSGAVHAAFTAGGLLFGAPLLMIVFRRKYPRWWFDWNIQLLGFSNRVGAYLSLLRDEYPSTDEEQAVHLEIPYPDAERDLNQWLPLAKWFLAIPHYVVLFFLGIAGTVAIIIAWFAILFTGRYPRGLFDFVVGVIRWGVRVLAYAYLLTTDRYPPFSLS
ncbi:DUF4389 domain-containing protein [Solihabitans fulvus]|uniref:DUF4389 domain-containing protein n=1 Tax=Solihabitans fulvus TaxID=1892852 RepID=A0A5B2X8U2_9PSEU|nr:DUF4389 domain-containing protein [Solihabitans fulvus]KAA2259556.1 DUF4389 domain-containing protein [Solihabitans fulvus]